MFTWCKDHSEEGAFDAIKCGHTYTNTVYKSFNERNLDYKCQDVPSIFENVWFFCFVSFVSFFFISFLLFISFCLFPCLSCLLLRYWIKFGTCLKWILYTIVPCIKITICKVSTNGWEIAFLLFGSYLKHLCTVEIGGWIQILIASIKTLVLVTD